MLHKHNSFFLIILSYNVSFVYFIGYDSNYRKSIVYELLTMLILYLCYYLYYNYYKNTVNGPYFVMWIDGMLLQLVLNTITILIYAVQFGKMSGNFNDKFIVLIQAFKYLLKNNFLVLVFAQFILSFSLAEMVVFYRDYKLTKKKTEFKSSKYYAMIWTALIIKLTIGICFVFVDVNGDILVGSRTEVYDNAIIMYNYITYSCISSCISSVFSFVLFSIVFKHGSTVRDTDNSDIDASILDFCRLQNYCVFIVDWKNVVISYYVFFFIYMCMVGWWVYSSEMRENYNLPDFACRSNVIDMGKLHKS